MQPIRFDVAIAGGGFVGRALALALAKLAPRDFSIALIDAERPGGATDDARASALSAASQRLLDVLGVWADLRPKVEPITSIEITDSGLDAALRPHLLGFDDEILPEDAQAVMIENADLSAALAHAVADEPAVRAFADESVVDFGSGPAGIEAKLQSGTTIAASLLVAADGRRSGLRDRAGIKCVTLTYAQIGIVATVAHERPHHGRAIQHFLPGGPFAILPLKGNRSSIVWTEEKEVGDAIMAASEADFVAELVRRFGDRLGAITLAGPRQSFPLELKIARSFIGERIALAGDAAHAVHPLAGQGLNIGLRDVAALAEVLVESSRLGLDLGSAEVITRYQRWRRFDSSLSAGVMDGLNRLFSNESLPLRALRDIGLAAVDRSPWLKRALVQEAAGFSGEVPRLLKGESF